MKRNKRFVLMAILVIVGLAFVLPSQAKKIMGSKDFVAECKPIIKAISVSEAKNHYDSKEWKFLDVRTEKEFKRGNIQNAVHLQRGLLEFAVEKKFPNKSAKIIVYCKSGSRSTLSVCTLTKMGYTNVVSMAGGWKGWVKEGHPIG